MTDTPKNEYAHLTDFVTDAVAIKRLGLPEKLGYENFRALDSDRRSGFPKKHEFWGGRRWWPAVFRYMDELDRTSIVPPQPKERTYASGR